MLLVRYLAIATITTTKIPNTKKKVGSLKSLTNPWPNSLKESKERLVSIKLELKWDIKTDVNPIQRLFGEYFENGFLKG